MLKEKRRYSVLDVGRPRCAKYRSQDRKSSSIHYIVFEVLPCLALTTQEIGHIAWRIEVRQRSPIKNRISSMNMSTLNGAALGRSWRLPIFGERRLGYSLILKVILTARVDLFLHHTRLASTNKEVGQEERRHALVNGYGVAMINLPLRTWP